MASLPKVIWSDFESSANLDLENPSHEVAYIDAASDESNIGKRQSVVMNSQDKFAICLISVSTATFLFVGVVLCFVGLFIIITSTDPDATIALLWVWFFCEGVCVFVAIMIFATTMRPRGKESLKSLRRLLYRM
ncbi:MAG: hypothetical protein V2I33_18655 [Kangiellaceae bacterium]|jgi:hypothetical protein|nr:hypothetical protein [Kangiellaceae bacterium]